MNTKIEMKKVVCSKCHQDITHHQLWGMWQEKIYCFDCLCEVIPPLTVVSVFGFVGGKR